MARSSRPRRSARPSTSACFSRTTSSAAAAGGRGHDADPPWEARQGTLAALREEPLRPQPGLELLECELERPEPPRLEQLDHELVLAALGIDLEAAEREHVLSVAGLEAQP